MTTEITIDYIKTNNLIYIKCDKDYLYDGVPSKTTFHKEWRSIPSIPNVVKRIITKYFKSFKLKYPEQFSHLPVERPFDECVLGYDRDEDPIYKKDFDPCLYTRVYAQEETEEILKVNWNLIDTVEFIEPPKHFNFKIDTSAYKKEITEPNTPLINQIIVPNLLIHETECYLSSHEMYQIVRKHIKENIDLNVAAITSDYDFCFEVCKLIELWKPEEFRSNLNEFTKKKPKYETRYRNSRKVIAFSMTYSPKKYEGYPVIPEFRGDSWEDLREKVQDYLDKIMKGINEPLRDCPHCKGMGIFINE